MGRLTDLFGVLHAPEREWCCERCRAAAMAAGHGLEDRQVAHQDDANPDGDPRGQASPDVIERRA